MCDPVGMDKINRRIRQPPAVASLISTTRAQKKTNASSWSGLRYVWTETFRIAHAGAAQPTDIDRLGREILTV